MVSGGHGTGSDVIMGWVDEDGVGFVRDFHVAQYETPTLDAQQDVSLESASTEYGMLRIAFSRRLDTGDPEDRPIVLDDSGSNQPLIWAFNPHDDAKPSDATSLEFEQHHFQGMGAVDLEWGADECTGACIGGAEVASEYVSLFEQCAAHGWQDYQLGAPRTETMGEPCLSNTLNTYRAWWSRAADDPTSVDFTVSARVEESSWIAIGFGTTPNMGRSDMVMGWVDAESGEAVVTDRYAVRQEAPREDVELEGTNDVRPSRGAVGLGHDRAYAEAEESEDAESAQGDTSGFNVGGVLSAYEGGWLTISFRRSITTGDKYDTDLSEPVYLLWAFGGGNSVDNSGDSLVLVKHIDRGFTDQRVNVTETCESVIVGADGKSRTNMAAHGVFMLVAWLLFVNTGAVIGRFRYLYFPKDRAAVMREAQQVRTRTTRTPLPGVSGIQMQVARGRTFSDGGSSSDTSAPSSIPSTQVPRIMAGDEEGMGTGVRFASGRERLSGKHQGRRVSQWFKIHVILEIVGFILFTVGFIVAVANAGGITAGVHQTFGSLALMAGLLQVVLGALRPAKTERKRQSWLKLHRVSGLSALVCSNIALPLGLWLFGTQTTKLQLAWPSGLQAVAWTMWGLHVLFTLGFVVWSQYWRSWIHTSMLSRRRLSADATRRPVVEMRIPDVVLEHDAAYDGEVDLSLAETDLVEEGGDVGAAYPSTVMRGRLDPQPDASAGTSRSGDSESESNFARTGASPDVVYTADVDASVGSDMGRSDGLDTARRLGSASRARGRGSGSDTDLDSFRPLSEPDAGERAVTGTLTVRDPPKAQRARVVLGVYVAWTLVVVLVLSSTLLEGLSPVIPEPVNLDLCMFFDEVDIPRRETSYLCRGVQFPTDNSYHVTRFQPMVDADEYVHHMVLYITDEAQTSDVYDCPAMPSNARPLYVWSQGRKSFEPPNDVGFRVGAASVNPAGLAVPATKYGVLQIHYNNPHARAALDSSGVLLSLTSHLRPIDAAFLPVGVAEDAIAIPPGKTAYGLQAVCDNAFSGEQSTAIGELSHDFATFAYGLHMHGLGRRIWVEQWRDGERVLLPDGRNPLGGDDFYDSNRQRMTRTQARLLSGDTLVARCVWENTEIRGAIYGNDVAAIGETVYGCESADCEMCVSYVAYYPAVYGGQNCLRSAEPFCDDDQDGGSGSGGTLPACSSIASFPGGPVRVATPATASLDGE